MRNFLDRRKKDVKLIKEKKLERSRRNGFSEDVRAGWFGNLKNVMDKNDLVYKPMQIFNVDESGFADETQCKKTLRFLIDVEKTHDE